MAASRRAATALLLLTGAALAAPQAVGVGGVALHGAGFGTYRSNDGLFVCPGSPFALEVLFTPDGHAVLHSEFAASCGGGGATLICCMVSVNTTRNPIAEVTFFCDGTEAAGVHCAADVAGTPVTADVGPYPGPGGTSTFATAGAFRFDGTFTAV